VVETVEEIEVGTVELAEVEIVELAEVETVEETAVVETVELAEVETVEETVLEPQNLVIGVTVSKAEVETADQNEGGIVQRLAQIIHSKTGIINHAVRPHSVQYNSFLRSSLFILNE